MVNSSSATSGTETPAVHSGNPIRAQAYLSEVKTGEKQVQHDLYTDITTSQFIGLTFSSTPNVAQQQTLTNDSCAANTKAHLSEEVPVHAVQDDAGQLVFGRGEVVVEQPLSEEQHVRVLGNPDAGRQVVEQVQRHLATDRKHGLSQELSDIWPRTESVVYHKNSATPGHGQKAWFITRTQWHLATDRKHGLSQELSDIWPQTESTVYHKNSATSYSRQNAGFITRTQRHLTQDRTQGLSQELSNILLKTERTVYHKNSVISY